MIIALIIIFGILFISCFITRYFAHAVPFLGAIATPLIIICVVVGVILAVFVSIEIYTKLRGKK